MDVNIGVFKTFGYSLSVFMDEGSFYFASFRFSWVSFTPARVDVDEKGKNT